MIHIGKSYIRRENGMSRLCADITISPEGKNPSTATNRRTLWFSIDSRQESYLLRGRADAFVFALLIPAIRGSYDIVCEDPLSERLHYQLCSSLIPALSFTGAGRRKIAVYAPLTSVRCPNRNAVGTGFSGGADCLYTIMTHGANSEYPLTHIAVYNAVTFQKYGPGYREIFRSTCRAAERFAQEQNLETVYVDTNFYETFAQEDTNAVCPIRHFACSLALQGLFSVYLISSDRSADAFTLDLSSAASYDLLSAGCAQTETLTFYSAGAEADRCQKITRLADWEPSYRWLHACYSKRIAGQRNCGICKKCKEVQTILYALGKLDRYAAVFDVENYKRRLPQYLAYLMANQDYPPAGQILKLIRDRNVSVPPKAYILKKQIQNAVRGLKQAQAAKEASHE